MILRATFLAASLAFGAVAPALAAVIAPDQPVNGVSQPDLSARWWQWMLTYPAATNPVLDTTGQNSHLGGDQTAVSHPGVFFLAGNFSGFESRTVTVASSESLFLPLINTVSFIPAFGNTEAEIRADAAATLGTVSGLFARLDGIDLPLPASASSLLDFRQQSALFSLTFPADNVYGVTPGSYDSVADGYWLALEALAPGHYTLEFGASATGTPDLGYPPFSLTQTYDITVVPEPATWQLLVAGLICGAVLSRPVRRGVDRAS